MKKFISVMLATVMVVAAIMAVCTVPAAAATGEWSVYSIKSQYADDYTGIMSDIPGYEYTGEGLRMIPAEWKDSTPYATFQTSVPVNLMEGVYLEVRIDQFSYDASDKWFGFSLWDEQNVELGNNGDGYGYGVETLIRHVGVSVDAETGLPKDKPDKYDEKDPKTWAGAMLKMEWYKDLAAGERIDCGAYDKEAYQYKFDEQGRPILVFEVKWSAADDMCFAYINGVEAPDFYNQAIQAKFESANWMAYVGFTLQNNKKGGTAGCTILKYGTSEADAEPPVGSDKKPPKAFSNEVAPLADPNDIPAGYPAIRLTGSLLDSNVAGKPSSYKGNTIVVNEDGSVNLTAAANGSAAIQFRVANDISYAAEDFPIVLFIMRNFCTCTYKDSDGDGNPEKECACEEKFNSFAMAGEEIKEGANFSYAKTEMWPSDVVYTDDDMYTWFIADWSKTNSGTGTISGRIHGFRLDFSGVQSDRNNFDICEIAFFRTAEEAKAYFAAYVEDLGAQTPSGGDGETDPEENTTPEETNGATTPEDGTKPEEPGDNTAPVEPSDKNETDKPADKNEGDGDKAAASSCMGVVGVGTIAVVAIVAAGLVSFKKKED